MQHPLHDPPLPVLSTATGRTAGAPTALRDHGELQFSRSRQLSHRLANAANPEHCSWHAALAEQVVARLAQATGAPAGECAGCSRSPRIVGISECSKEVRELKAWPNLIRVPTHEIMSSVSPMSSLASTARDLLDGVARPSAQGSDTAGTIRDVHDPLDTIAQRGNGLLQFVESYRKLTRLPNPRLRPFAAKELGARDGEYVPSHSSSRSLWSMLRIAADAGLAEQAVINLIRNAIDAIGAAEDGTIALAADVDACGRQLIFRHGQRARNGRANARKYLCGRFTRRSAKARASGRASCRRSCGRIRQCRGRFRRPARGLCTTHLPVGLKYRHAGNSGAFCRPGDRVASRMRPFIHEDIMRSNSSLRGTPSEGLDMSSPELMQLIVDGVAEAEKSGKWVRGFREAAADLKDMTLDDMIYWVYKTTNPVTRIEEDAENILAQGAIDRLPEGFVKQASLTLGAGGDLLQAEGLELSKDILFENVADLLFEQDVSFANLESPITRGALVKEVIGDKGPPIECCNHAQFDTLTSHKGKYFTVINTSNNHMFDRALEGIDTTHEALSEKGILNVGTNRKSEEHGKGRTLTVNGIKLGFAAATFGLNGHQVPEEESYRINTSSLLPRHGNPDLGLLKRQIDNCREQGCDFIIASLHWGFEFEMFPRKKQIEAARELIEHGADAVISHHPHVVQPVEYYQTQRDSNRIAPIAYSLGSLTWGFTAPHLALSLVQNLTLAKGRLNGKDVTYVEKSTVTPVFRSAIDKDGQTETRLEKLSDHIDGRSTRHPQDYIAAIKRYADLVLGQTMAGAATNQLR